MVAFVLGYPVIVGEIIAYNIISSSKKIDIF